MKLCIMTPLKFIFLFFLFKSEICSAKLVETELKIGKAIGTQETYKGKEYSAFYGIPYAKPPVGRLRFKPPEPLSTPWKDVQDFSKYVKIECPQKDIFSAQASGVFGSEDCLILNVYTPKTKFENGGDLLPVMVWIHGGAFVSGSGGLSFYGPQYFMQTQEVVLVTLNYRLGALGFLSLDDDVVSGNMGLKDQTLALRWVREHIKSFRGDPDQVTIFGESAGGISVAALVLSPWTSGLFQKAIIQSGGMVKAPFLHLSKSPAVYAHQLAEEFGFEGEDSSEKVLEILQAQTPEEIVEKSELFDTFFICGIPWIPIRDEFSKDPFIPGDFNALFQEGKFNKVPIMIGGTEDEGAMYMPQFINDLDKLKQLNSDFDNLAPVLLLGVDDDEVSEHDSATANLILREYLPGPDYNISIKNLKEFENILTDVEILGPINIQTKLLQDSLGNIPLYYYSYRHKDQLSLPRLQGLDPSVEIDLGVSHGDELFALFHTPDLEMMKSASLKEVSKKMIQLWTRFAVTDNPDPAWNPVAVSDLQPAYAILDSNPLRMANEEDFSKRMKFVESMLKLNEAFRDFDFIDHPAVVERIKLQEEEDAMESHDEL